MSHERHKTAPSCSFHLWPWGSRWQLAERKHQARKADPGSEDSLFVAKHPEVLRSFFLFKKTPLPSTVSHFSSFILRELHLTLYLVAHDHQPLYLIDSTSFNQSSTFSILSSPSRLPASRRDKLRFHQFIVDHRPLPKIAKLFVYLLLKLSSTLI